MDEYRRQSVADGGAEWIDKFNTLVVAKENEKRLIVLSNDADLPAGPRTIPDYGVFQRGNIWMLEDALIRPNADVTLVALWNGKAGDGPGGTEGHGRACEAHGAKVLIKNTDELFGLPPEASILAFAAYALPTATRMISNTAILAATPRSSRCSSARP